MKVKFEIEISEFDFYKITDSISNAKTLISLTKIFKGKKFIVDSYTCDKKSIKNNGIVERILPDDGELNLICVDNGL